MIPGEIIIAAGAPPLPANANLATVSLPVANTGDRPIQVGSHYHFFETNEGLRFDRAAARGFRLNIPAGTAVRFEAGETKQVELVALAGAQRDIQLKTALERDVRLVRFEQGVLEFSLAPGGSPGLAAQLTRKLQDWTGQRWMVALSTAPGAETLVEAAEAREKERRVGVQAHPLVRATLDQFPGAVIVAVRGGETEAVAAPDEKTPSPAEDVAYIDDSEDEDF